MQLSSGKRILPARNVCNRATWVGLTGKPERGVDVAPSIVDAKSGLLESFAQAFPRAPQSQGYVISKHARSKLGPALPCFWTLGTGPGSGTKDKALAYLARVSIWEGARRAVVPGRRVGRDGP